MKDQWHLASLENIFSNLATSKSGLTEIVAKEKLKQYGLNQLPKEKPYSKLRLFINQFNSPLVIIFLVACGISLYLGHFSDAIFIIVVLLINTTVGFYQENKANASLAALRSMVKISARVLRDENMKEIDSTFLVPGDIIFLKAGDKVPADTRLIEVKGLKIDESSLTGEWIAVSKSTEDVVEGSSLADRTNMAFMGSIVEEGTATAVVVETGTNTSIGGIVSMLRETKERPTPLQEKISYLSRWVGAFVLGIIFIVIILGYLNGKSFADIFIASLALAVSAIPAGLLPAITVILVLGMRRILKSNGLVRKLIANETLGSVTVICTDKTGTLTEGKMQVSHILTGTQELLNNNHDPIVDIKHFNGLESHILALKAAVLTNDAFIENPDDEFHEWIVRGGPTQRALLVAGTHAGLSQKKLGEEYPVIEKLSFTSEAKFSASLHSKPDGTKVLYVVGAPEVVASKSINFHVDGTIEKLNSNVHTKLLQKLETLTHNGLRVVACAHREFGEHEKLDRDITTLVDGLTLVGYIALKDPLRADAHSSIALTKRAGIRTVLITGDHRLTAQSIAKEVGIDATDSMILEGKDLEEMTDKELELKVKDVAIYARVSPGHKLRIVKALQSQGEVVAMIGDGVNDAPALKAADVGVSVGSGTDVAKEVADIVLLDDSFSTIVKAIEQGRVIFQNIRKVFVYLIADDFSELFLFLMAMAFGLPLPLLAAQILWINLVEDGLPDISLTTEQETTGVMDEKPRDPKEPILNKPMRKWMTAIFFITGFAAFFSFFFLWKTTGDIDKTRSIVFALMCLDSLIFAFSVRSFKRPMWRKDIFSNRILVGAVFIGLVLLFASVYLSPLQKLLSTQPLMAIDWLIIAAISTVEIVLIEWFKKKSFRSNVVTQHA
jgi:Ca2+-transporting ATPase